MLSRRAAGHLNFPVFGWLCPTAGAEMHCNIFNAGNVDMLNSTLLLGFIATALVVLLIPGLGAMYVVARSLGQGRLAGVITALGQAIGVLVPVLQLSSVKHHRAICCLA